MRFFDLVEVVAFLGALADCFEGVLAMLEKRKPKEVVRLTTTVLQLEGDRDCVWSCFIVKSKCWVHGVALW